MPVAKAHTLFIFGGYIVLRSVFCPHIAVIKAKTRAGK